MLAPPRLFLCFRSNLPVDVSIPVSVLAVGLTAMLPSVSLVAVLAVFKLMQEEFAVL